MNFKLMNNFIKDYGILRIGLGIWGVSLFICVYQESEEKNVKGTKDTMASRICISHEA